MKRKIDFLYSGQEGHIGEMAIMHMLPNSRIEMVGPFVIADLIARMHFKARVPKLPDGHGAHPHRGIATFTYLVHGELEHFDSKGHYGIINDGGGQWMNAGNGIIHDENYSQAFQKSGGTLLGMQFWINLPSEEKKKAPDYMAVHDADLPKIKLNGDAGIMKVVIGSYSGKTSEVKTFSEQFIYHLKLSPDKSFDMDITNSAWDYAAFAINGTVIINDTELNDGTMMVFGKQGSSIRFENHTSDTTDILLFGGEPYGESIFAKGPFVMNSEAEIKEAYNDYYKGKYGNVDHSKVRLLPNQNVTA